MSSTISPEMIQAMDYVSFMGFLNETNRPPGGKDSMRKMAQNAFLTSDSKVLHSGCNTGYCSFELSHLTKCQVTALDINESMLASAQERLLREPLPYRDKITFEKGDAHALRFEDNTFDLVMSGGSTAFMKDKDAVVREYMRVCKPYGFVGDVFLYYHAEPPQDLVDTINHELNIDIKKWGKEYWTSLYTDAGLELYYIYDAPMPTHPTQDDVQNYCESIVSPLRLSTDAHEEAVRKLFKYMDLFNQNHAYLSYAVLLCRKNPFGEQTALFGL